MIQGYDADIPQPFWRRTQQYGIPTKWFAVWLGCVVLEGTHILYLTAWWWVWKGVGIVALALVEMALLQWVTRADGAWDSLLNEQLWRRVENDYDAH
jgi:hypothetical protein